MGIYVNPDHVSFKKAEHIFQIKKCRKPFGKGYADLVFVPKKNKDVPAMIIELKCNKTSEEAIAQIKERKYMEGMQEYRGNMLLVGISYDRKSKKHSCAITEW